MINRALLKLYISPLALQVVRAFKNRFDFYSTSHKHIKTSDNNFDPNFIINIINKNQELKNKMILQVEKNLK
jgi:hypothetical protein